MVTTKKHSGKDLTIFSEMTALANKCGAVNLSQGFPDYEIDERLKKYLSEATSDNFNQYAPMQGNPKLIENLVEFNNLRKNPIKISDKEITIIPGATYGIYAALAAILEFGDEVIVLEPSYDSYVPAIEANGGKPIFVSLDENFRPDFTQIEVSISEKTKAILVNSPHNPTGKIWTKEDWAQLYKIIENTNIFVLSDEVYDLITFDGNEFYSAFHHPELRKRSFCIFSFGKMFHATGWKIGYILAEEDLSWSFRRIHQYLCFSVNAPAQQALANYLGNFDVEENSKLLQKKRDFFCNAIKETPFEITEKAEGSYFQIVNFRNINAEMTDKEFAIWLTVEKKVASIPLSAFYHQEENTGNIRFCFTKKEETIVEAIKRLRF